MAHLGDHFARIFNKLARFQLLILDDGGAYCLNIQQSLELLEIFEERYWRKSILITAQLSLANWFDMPVELTIFNAILDAFVHDADRATRNGESMRKRRSRLLTNTQIGDGNPK